ncbi:hypothetical protein DPEC_G00198090 [Dallia pectoralis]|uniref:Uncharacterized protein n=1 Tax=Dallia pectoralis TaxID=75939 RepID=A0ACC2G863_DALPE|nr:hypothetical protein DPEC_G00198090 [Dallia pectoralis]
MARRITAKETHLLGAWCKAIGHTTERLWERHHLSFDKRRKRASSPGLSTCCLAEDWQRAEHVCGFFLSWCLEWPEFDWMVLSLTWAPGRNLRNVLPFFPFSLHHFFNVLPLLLYSQRFSVHMLL